MCIKTYFKVWSSSIQVKVEASQGTHHRHDGPSHRGHEHDFSILVKDSCKKMLLEIISFKELLIFLYLNHKNLEISKK